MEQLDALATVVLVTLLIIFFIVVRGDIKEKKNSKNN